MGRKANRLMDDLVLLYKDGWRVARTKDTNNFVGVHMHKGSVRFTIKVNPDTGEARVVVGRKNLGVVSSATEVKFKLGIYLSKGGEVLPRVLLGKDHELGEDLRQLVLKYLRTELCVVKFQKADGTKREMLCSLLPTFMPELEQSVAAAKARKVKQENNPYLITLWDVENEGYRAFSLERMYRITIV